MPKKVDYTEVTKDIFDGVQKELGINVESGDLLVVTRYYVNTELLRDGKVI